MDRIQDIEAFLAVVERGNLSAASRHLERSLQSVSRSLASLERSVGTELISRTTHQSQPTDAGLRFYDRVRPALAELFAARDEIGLTATEPSGLLRIGAPVEFGAMLMPVIGRFMSRYDKVEIDLRLEDRFVDIVGEGLDVAIRVGEAADADLMSRQVGRARRVVFGAPSYFAIHGRPRHPGELRDHQCVFRSTDAHAGTWRFRLEGRSRLVRVAGRLRLQNAEASHAAVIGGLGIGWAPIWQIQRFLDSREAVVILEAFEEEAIPIRLLWPATKHLPAKTRLLIDVLAEHPIV